RLDDARDRERGGAGLGLAIVKETIRRHNGTVEVMRAPIGGARFEIRLPIGD
ncbi:MAG: ATP-binding protein, partial [Actinomycetota bacterium]